MSILLVTHPAHAQMRDADEKKKQREQEFSKKYGKESSQYKSAYGGSAWDPVRKRWNI